MAPARIRWTAKAVDDLEAIRAFISRSSPLYRSLVVRPLVLAVSQIERHLLSGRIVPKLGHADVRELVRGNFRVVYRLQRDTVELLTAFRATRAFPFDDRDHGETE